METDMTRLFDETTIKAAWELGNKHNIHPAAILAVAQVESAGKVYAKVDGNNEPLIRFEGHYFDKRLTPAQKTKARKAGLSSPKAGAVGNPARQQDRWERLLKPAMAINRQAALESCSWGLGQVMGSHWKALGYDRVESLVAEARSGASGQIALMVRFIVKNGLVDELARRDWAGFAARYNGPGYKKNRYHLKMRDTFASWQKYDFAKFDKAPPKPAPIPPEVELPPVAKPVEAEKTGAGAKTFALIFAAVSGSLAYYWHEITNWFGGIWP